MIITNIRIRLLLFFMLLSLTSSIYAVDYSKEISTNKKKLESIYKKLNKQKYYLDKTSKQANDVFQGIKKIDVLLKKQDKSLKKISGQQIDIKKEISSLEAELAADKKQFNKVLVQLSKKYENYYKIRNTSFIENLLNFENFTEYLQSLHLFETAIGDDVVFLQNVREKSNKMKYKQARLSSKLEVLQDREQTMSELKYSIEKNRNKKKKLYSSLIAQKKEYQRKLRKLNQESKQFELLIQKLTKKYQNYAQIGSGKFIWPVLGKITSKFGYRIHPIFKVKSMHTGLDIAAPKGRPVFAADDGIVMYSGKWGGYGKSIVIDHGKSITTLYAHLSKYYVKRTMKVKKGQIIGLVGATGWATGPHLHFEVRKNGKVKNPINYLPKI